MSIETQSNQQRIIKLAAANSNTAGYFSDQIIFEYGTMRTSQLRGKIGDNGQPFEKLLNDSINSL